MPVASIAVVQVNVSPLLVHATFSLSGVIIVEASLSFLGLGAQDGAPSWGALLGQGRTVLLEAPNTREFEEIFKATPVDVPAPNEPQGEAVAWGTDAHSYFTSSEKKGDETPLLYKVECLK